MLQYLVELLDTAGHYLDLSLRFSTKQSDWQLKREEKTLELTLPTWIPGSYLIREFSKNIVNINAEINGKPSQVIKTRKDAWEIRLSQDAHNADDLEVLVKWKVYAWDLSVRSAHVDNTHAFFNGTSVYLLPTGFDQAEATVTIRRGAQIATPWRLVCGLPRLDQDGKPLKHALPQGAETLQAGESAVLYATNYDELIDHPVEMGELMIHEFSACGIPHYFAVYGADQDTDLKRLCDDLTPVLEAQIRLFEPTSSKPPFSAYWFMLHATDNGYGGLEHRNSTALVCSRSDLPQIGVKKTPEGYDTLMGLCSHEYFHSWNVKRIKPAAFSPYNLASEGYTRLLWVFEGFTSYYDDLMLARAGYYDETGYLKALSKSVSHVLKSPGRFVQSVSESSLEAWTKYYRQDENAPNAIVSYYTKGALIAFCIDIHLRKATANAKSLDDVMRYLWQNYGKQDQGVPEEEMANIIEAATDVCMKDLLSQWVDTTAELPLIDLADYLQIHLEPDTKPEEAAVWLGANGTHSSSGMKLKQVINFSPAHKAGLSAGDLLIAIDSVKIDESTLKRRLMAANQGDICTIHFFRAGKLFTTNLIFENKPTDRWLLKISQEQPSSSFAPWK